MHLDLDSVVTEFHENNDKLTDHICELLRPVILHHAVQMLQRDDWNHTEIDEIVNEALIHTIVTIKRYQTVANIPFGAYYNICIRWWLLRWIKRHVRNHRSSTISVSSVSHDNIGVVADRHAIDAPPSFDHAESIALKDLLEQLPQVQRDVFLLHSLYSYSFSEISHMTGIARTNVYTQFQLARNQARTLAAGAPSTQAPRPKTKSRRRQRPDPQPSPPQPPPSNPPHSTPTRVYARLDRTESPAPDMPYSPNPLSSHAQRIQLLDTILAPTEVAI